MSDFENVYGEEMTDEDFDYILEQQELEDFAQDGDFENMEAWEIM